MPNQEARTTLVLPNTPTSPLFYGPAERGPISPLTLPEGLPRIRAARLIQCLRHLITTGSPPSPSLFFQNYGKKECLKRVVNIFARSTLLFGVLYSVPTALLAVEAVSRASIVIASAAGALVITATRARKHAIKATLSRDSNRKRWGFSVETKSDDLTELEQISKMALELIPGLSQKIAARHRWTFNIQTDDGQKQAARIVCDALIGPDALLEIETRHQIDAGNIQRFKDTAQAMLTATANNLSG